MSKHRGKTATVFEYQHLACGSGVPDAVPVPVDVFEWLERECLRINQTEAAAFAKLRLRNGRRTIQMTNSVGVIRAPNCFQIEVLPKIGKLAGDNGAKARTLLLDMLACLKEFRHIQTDRASLAARRMPLLEVFIAEFLDSVRRALQRGLRSHYDRHEENLVVMRGKLMVSENLKRNLVRPDRVFVAFDEFSQDRPENRLIHSALAVALGQTTNPSNQQLARELRFAFSDIPLSRDPDRDFSRVTRQPGMHHYAESLEWARMLLTGLSPLTGAGDQNASSLLFPMEALFEAFVAKHMRRQLTDDYELKAQNSSKHLLLHRGRGMFRMRPDILLARAKRDVIVVDTKWKLLNANAEPGAKYWLSQSDLYQMHAYGHSFLKSKGDVLLVYPRSEYFAEPLEPFRFTEHPELTLWVLPFSLETKRLVLPTSSEHHASEMLRAFG